MSNSDVPSSFGMLSSLATYDSDEEIGNTPKNEQPSEETTIPTAEQEVSKSAHVSPNISAHNQSIERDNKPLDEEYSENASAVGKPEGGSQGGEYNMLPSEFDSDDDKRFSDEDEQGRHGKREESGLVSYTAQGDEIEDEEGGGGGTAKNMEEQSDDGSGNDEETKQSTNEETESAQVEEFVPEWMKGVDLSEPNALASLLHKKKPKREEMVLPPLSKKKCPRDLQEKFERHHAAVKAGKDFIKLIESKTEYRNPSIYEKLVQHLKINEKGTNFPKSVFNPRGFPRTAYYDELARIQNELHAKKQQQKNSSPQTAGLVSTAANSQTSVVSIQNEKATVDLKRPVGGGSGSEDPASRKSKWDLAPPTSSTNISASGASATSSATIIPASGPLKKPKLDL